MPNFDGGHYFLTVLAPVRNDTVPDGNGTPVSCEQALRDALACLPTALQSAPTIATDLNSPFSRDLRTHFARFSVISDVVYNGRTPTDAILNALKGVNPILPQPVDRLTCPFLLFALDFDAANGTDAERDEYLKGLWPRMEAELRAVFQYCVGFDKVTDAASFADYIAKCQIETTMSFNDYWITPPPLPTFNVKFWGSVVGLAAVVFLASLVVWLFGLFGANTADWWVTSLLPSWTGWGGIVLISFIATGVLIWLAYRSVLSAGEKPFPKAPNSDLKSVLKAVYLQQQFTDFAIANQGRSVEDLHAAFARFLDRNKPSDLDAPTQTPGVLRSPSGGV